MIHEDLMFALIEFIKSVDTARKMYMEKNDLALLPSGFASQEGLVLKHGNAMPVSDFRVHRGPMKKCFMNAQKLMTHNRSLPSRGRRVMKVFRYCEGYAIKDGLPFPVLHAWCIDEDGAVVDPTWQPTKRQVDKGLAPRVGYFGIVFKDEYVWNRQLVTERYTSLIDDYPTFPLLTERGLLKKVTLEYR